MQTFAKIVGLCLFAVSLAACDGQKEAAQATENSAAAQQTGQVARVLDGKVSFTVPAGLQDQNGQTPDQTSNMAVFSDRSAEKMVIVIGSTMPENTLENLINQMEAQQQSRDSNLRVIRRTPVNANGQTLQRLDTEIVIDGRTHFCSTLLGQVDDKLLTMQITWPIEQQTAAENAVEEILRSLTIAP